jgi:hypothetical protein
MKLEALDVGIGLIVLFLVVSTVCSAVREGIEMLLKTRAAYLERGIRELLDDPHGRGLAKSLFDHPLISGTFLGSYVPRPLEKKLWVLANGRGLPSYVAASRVAQALLDIAGRGAVTDEVSSDPASAPLTVSSIRARLLNVQSLRVRRVLLHALDASRGDLEQAKKFLEDWFNDAMERVSGWYKRATQWVVFVIAVVVSVGMNIDSLAVAKHLYRDEAARSAAVASAGVITSQGKPPTAEEAKKTLEALELPVGWSDGKLPKDGLGWLNRLGGWAITALAATLGAPFWFDVLNKVMVIRSTVKPREKSSEELSKDAQAPSSPARVTTVEAPRREAPVREAPTPVAVVFEPREPGEEHDGCGHGAESPPVDATPDEDLPPALGGVAS